MGGQQQQQQQQDDEYECSLSPQARAVAKLELREDERTREHALGQFRDWIRKHPRIRRCRTDGPFLLRFLRTKKFSLPLAQEALERYLTIRQLYPDWYRNLDTDDPAVQAIIDAGYTVPLLKRDSHGRRVFLTCRGRLDPYKFTCAQVTRVHAILCEALLDDEDNQVHGYVYVNDESGLTLAHLSSWSLSDIRNVVTSFQNIPVRHKMNHFINIPSCAMKIAEIALTFLNEKMRSRVQLHKSLNDLRQTVDPKILPKEYGGEVPLSDMIVELKKVLAAKRDEIKALDNMCIEILPKDTCSGSKGLEELTGSFRKLEVD